MDGEYSVGIRATMEVAMCIYIVARRQKHPISIIDIAFQVNRTLYELGAVYKTIVHYLHLEVEKVDPLLFLERAINGVSSVDKYTSSTMINF